MAEKSFQLFMTQVAAFAQRVWETCDGTHPSVATSALVAVLGELSDFSGLARWKMARALVIYPSAVSAGVVVGLLRLVGWGGEVESNLLPGFPPFAPQSAPKSKPEIPVVICVRKEWGDSPIPADVVNCEVCRQPCWVSKRLDEDFVERRHVCILCAPELRDEMAEAGCIVATPSTLEEVSEYFKGQSSNGSSRDAN